MGVIWLRTRDGSTSHKILPEFPDLCVLLLLLFVTWPIYLLQKHQVKGNPGNLKSNWKPSQIYIFLFRKQFAELKSMFYFCFQLLHGQPLVSLRKVPCEFIYSNTQRENVSLSDHLTKLQWQIHEENDLHFTPQLCVFESWSYSSFPGIADTLTRKNNDISIYQWMVIL